MYCRIYPFLLFSFILLGIQAQTISYKLEGVAPDNSFNNLKVYLQELNEDRNNFINIDSTEIKDQKFTFSETIENNNNSTIRFISVYSDETKPSQYLFVPEEGVIKMTVGDTHTISGTPKNDEIQAFFNEQDSIQTELKAVINKYANVIQSTPNQIKRSEELRPIANRLQKNVYDFAKANIQNYVGEFIAFSSYGILSSSQILELVSLTRPEFRNSDLAKQIVTYYEAEMIKDGEGPYKDIQLKNPDGKSIALSDYVGKNNNKVVLIDFWASWCGPCLKEMPNIVKAYEQYKDKGFEIIGISLDENKLAWQKAIDRFNITWPQMSDLKGWHSDAAKLYGITSIPFTLLVDDKGNIIDSYLYGDKLISRLKEILD